MRPCPTVLALAEPTYMIHKIQKCYKNHNGQGKLLVCMVGDRDRPPSGRNRLTKWTHEKKGHFLTCFLGVARPLAVGGTKDIPSNLLPSPSRFSRCAAGGCTASRFPASSRQNCQKSSIFDVFGGFLRARCGQAA